MSKISAAALLQLADQFDRQKKCLDLWEKDHIGHWGGVITPRKTNMSPENQWLEDACPIEIVPF